MTLRESAELLREAGVDEPLQNARELWRRFTSFSDIELLNKDISCDSDALISAIRRRAAREPLQYIIGEVYFYNEVYRVTPDCLIPRSDTEILVEYAVKNIPSGESFIDLCTGSGCIAVSTLNNTKDTTAVAVDVSRPALALALENAARNGVGARLTAVACDLMEDEPKGEFFAILSNPPYVTTEEYEGLADEIYREPRIAFLGGEDGGDFYRRLIPLCKGLMKKGGFIAFEIGYRQGELLRALAREHSLSCQLIKDYSGLDRVAVLREN